MKKYIRFIRTALVMAFVLTAALSSRVSAQAAEDIVLVLDPGHDSQDAGARRTWDGVAYEEETIVLKMAKYCKQELDKYAGIQVHLTRTTNNVDMDRYDRVKIAKDLEADALVSMHINSTSKHEDTVSGALAYVPTYSNKEAYAVEARSLAADIVENLSTVGMKNLGYLKDENLGIIVYGKLWKIPTMIIEHGFVNNPADCKKYYASNSKIRKIAVADAKAIAAHYGLKRKTGWQQDGSAWVYYDTNGEKVTGWLTDGGKRYYLDEKGHKVTGLCKIEKKSYYFAEDGSLMTGLIRVGNTLYRTKTNGQIRTGWFTIGGKRYYAAKTGKLHRGFTKYKKNTWYFDLNTGAALTGWQLINKKYYYFDTKGQMQTGWEKIGKKYYYFNAKGVRQTGWLKYKGYYCYLDPQTGAKLTKQWLLLKGKYYYLKKSGVRLENTKKKIGGVVYRFDKNGVCLNKK